MGQFWAERQQEDRRVRRLTSVKIWSDTLDLRHSGSIPPVGRPREINVTRFILHIGPHKTGTTYLQVVLDTLRDALAERGVHIPSIWHPGPGNPGQAQLARAVRDGEVAPTRATIWGILARRPRYVVISAEDLCKLCLDDIVRLRQTLGHASVEIVYYARRLSERLPSLWQEKVKHGERARLPEFLETYLMSERECAASDTAILDDYAAVFGRDTIKIVSYSYLTDHSHDIARHFLASFLSFHDIVLPDIGRPNPSLPVFDVEAIRALNAMHALHGGERSAALRNWYMSNRGCFDARPLYEVMGSHLGTIRLDERSRPLVLASKDILARYAASLVPPWDRTSLYDLRSTDVLFVEEAYLRDPVAASCLNEIYAQYRQSMTGKDGDHAGLSTLPPV